MPSFQLPLRPSPRSTSASPDTASSSSAAAGTQSDAAAPSSEPRLTTIALLPDNAEQQDEEDHHGGVTWRERVGEVMSDNQLVINTFIAGGLAGAASRTVVSPLERLKIILQVQTAGKAGSGQAYTGVWDSLARMWREEGFQGFMKGNGINVIRILPYSALQFTSYGGFKSLLRSWSGHDELSTPARLAAGAGAGIVAVSATYPLDLVRARLSIATANLATHHGVDAFSAQDAKLGIIGMTKKVYRTEGGVRGLYRGCWATAVGVAPYVSLNFYIYETLRSVFLPEHLDPLTSSTEYAFRKLACGGFAGATSLIFTHPFDVLRRKLQVAGLSSVSPRYDGAIDAMRQIIKAEGFWNGMYRGLTPNIIKVAPSIAVSFYTFETVRDFLCWSQDTHAEEGV